MFHTAVLNRWRCVRPYTTLARAGGRGAAGGWTPLPKPPAPQQFLGLSNRFDIQREFLSVINNRLDPVPTRPGVRQGPQAVSTAPGSRERWSGSCSSEEVAW